MNKRVPQIETNHNQRLLDTQSILKEVKKHKLWTLNQKEYYDEDNNYQEFVIGDIHEEPWKIYFYFCVGGSINKTSYYFDVQSDFLLYLREFFTLQS